MEGTTVDVEVSGLNLFPLQKMKQRPMKSGSSQRVVGPRASAFVPVGTTVDK